MRFLNLLLFILWFSLAVAEPSFSEVDYGDYGEGHSFIRDTTMLWENGIIPYLFQDYAGSFSAKEKTMIRHAMNIIESQLVPGCINFTEVNANCSVCLKINKDSNQCKTTIGKLGGDPRMKLGNTDCFKDNGTTLLHELGHSIGLVHEQTRPDRDDYINVNGDLLAGRNANISWTKRTGKFGETYKTPYDLFSVMHYPISLGCKENSTCVTVNQPYLSLFTSNGQKLLEKYPDKLSPVDQYEISCAYKCNIYSHVLEQYLNYTEILHPGVNIYNETCLDKCEKRGKDFFWCTKNYTKYEPEPPFSYCSQSLNFTHLGKKCITECLQQNGKYFACNVTGDDWGFCSPQTKPDIHNLTLYQTPECLAANYYVLNEANRQVTGTGYDTFCDHTDQAMYSKDRHSKFGMWKGPGWYRFSGAAGTRMPDKAPGSNKCSTFKTGWISGSHPTLIGQTTDVKVCIQHFSNLCAKSASAKITHCGTFYVYNLPDVPMGCSARYCGTN